MPDRDEIRAALTGPVASLPTLFTRDGEIDYAAMCGFVDFVISAGAKTVLLTHGDSLYSLLSDQEIAEVTRTVVEHTAGRAMTVAADRAWSLPQEMAFARYVKELGVDLLMVLPPDWANSCTEDSLVSHYEAVAAQIPVMVVTNLYARRPALGLAVLQRLCEGVGGVVAVKDDVGGEFARKLSLLVHDRWAVISGGLKQNHLNMVPYGCDGYFSTMIKFKPTIAGAYWSAVQAEDWQTAREIIARYDMPFFDYIRQLPGGFDAGIHGILEIAGLGGRWRRLPYHSLTDEEMARLARFLRAHQLL